MTQEHLTQQPSRHAARLAITPDAESEVAAVLRLLTQQPWLYAGRDDAAISTVRRNLNAVRSVLTRLGWPLIVERDLVRVVKSPPGRLAAYAEHAPSPLTCAWVFLLAAAAEGLPQQVTIGQLIEAGRKAAADADVPLTGDPKERRAQVAAVHELEDRGVLEETDGQIDAYLADDNAPVLLTVFHTRLLHLVVNYDPTTDPSAAPQRWLDNVTREPDAGRRMRRRLVDDTCVHTIDLDDAEADWLSRRLRGDDGGPLAVAFGLAIERRAEGAAFVVPDEAFRWPKQLGQVPFPGAGIVPHAAMLLADVVGTEGQVSGGPGPGWRGMPREEVLTTLSEIASRQATGRGGWPEESVADPAGLLVDAERLLTGVGLLRPMNGWWWLSPVMGRWEAPPNSAFSPSVPPPVQPLTQHASPDAAAPSLFDTHDDLAEEDR